MPEFSNNMLYYNAEEAARELDRSAPEIENLIRSGHLQTEIVDEKRVIPAQALEDFHAGISLPDIKARVMLEEGNNDRLVEPDQIAILPENSDAGESHNVDPEGTYYYEQSQVEEMLSVDLFELNKLFDRRGELPVVYINEHRWFPAEAVEDLVRRKHGPGRLTHAPQPRRIQQLGNKVPKEPQVETDTTADKRSVNSSKMPSDKEEMVEAAQKFGTSTGMIRQMIATGQLVRHPSSGHLVKSAQNNSEIASESTSSSVQKILSEALDDERSMQIASEFRAEKLEEEMQTSKTRWQSEREIELEQELDLERKGRKQDNLNARYEIDQSNAQTENLRRDYAMQSETLQEDLEEERRRRLDSEQRAKELEDQLEKQKEQKLAIEEPLENKEANEDFYGQLRTGVKGVIDSLRDSVSREDEDERWRGLELALEDSKRKLEEERNRRLKREEWVADMQAKLERNEASNIELREALSSEKEKALRLEENQRVLDEVRRLLEMQPAPPLERTEIIAPKENSEEEPDKSSDELIIQTRHGQWTFLSPFALEEDEIELIRLVAGEDEITAEQIKRKTGRRRAVDDLDDLLDRLADEGLVPIKEINDRYSFDPNFLQD